MAHPLANLCYAVNKTGSIATVALAQSGGNALTNDSTGTHARPVSGPWLGHKNTSGGNNDNDTIHRQSGYDAEVNSNLWNYVHYAPVDNPSFFGRTQMQQSLPAIANGAALLTLNTYDPTGPGKAFVGTDIYTSQTFQPGSTGIAFQVVAKMDQTTGGLVGGIFPYNLLDQATTDHNEIDTELVSNAQTSLSVNNYADEPLGAGNPQTVPLPAGDDLTQWHTYTMVWQTSQISWYIDGNLVAQTNSNVPIGAMPLYLDFWAPASDWAYAYNGSLQPVSSQAANTTFGFEVKSALVAQLSPSASIGANVLGNVGNYTFAPTGSGQLQIEDNATGDISTVPAGSVVSGSGTFKTLQGITFADASAAFDPTGNAAVIARLYEATVARAPDLGGLAAYTQDADTGQISLASIGQVFATSPEFIADFGQLSNQDFISRIYINLLGRTADAGGLASYTADLNAGESRGAVLADMVGSFEARQHWTSIAGNANDATVYRLYAAILDRVPDSGGWQSYSADLSAGQTIQQLAAAMLQSGEYLASAGDLTNTAFVQRLYGDLLKRPADPGGLATYVGDLNNGLSRAALVAAVVGSGESRLVTAQATHDGWVTAT